MLQDDTPAVVVVVVVVEVVVVDVDADVVISSGKSTKKINAYFAWNHVTC